jgi:CDP-6-deoxy-D-xylo-4-hexulose-3-dehydrase
MVTKQEILNLIEEYMAEKQAAKIWTPGKDWVQYSGPYFDGEEYSKAINTLLDEWLILGQDAVEFEKTFPSLLGKYYGIITNSGSSANLLMMVTAKKYFKLKNRTKVIVPVAGFPTTVNPIIQAGFEPVFIDIDPWNLGPDLYQVKIAAKNGAAVIIFAHVLGNPPNMDELIDIMDRYGMIFLEDCCDALGSTYRNKPLGSYGKLSTCSFYPAHHMTMGEGGFLACENEEQKKIARSFREWGRGCYCVGKKANLSPKGTCGCRFKNWLPSLPEEIFDHKYVYDNIGYNLKPIELQCSIGLAQMKKLPKIHEIRKANYKRLYDIFKPYEEFLYIHEATPNSDPSWFAFPLTVKQCGPFTRSKLTSYLEEYKIQTRNYFGGNLLLQPAYADIGWWHNDYGILRQAIGMNAEWARKLFPVATLVTTNTFFLGTSPVITSPQLDYVEQIVKEFFKNI